MGSQGKTQFTQARLFLDATKKSNKSWDVIEHLQRNLKAINYNGFIIQATPIQSKTDKELLYKNGITHLPALLYNQTQTIGANKINDVLSRIAKVSAKKADAAEQLRREQMAEMDMDKYENGEYDDDGAYDEDDAFAGDKDVVKQNIQKRMRDFNKSRDSRVNKDPNARRKGGKNRKKAKKQDNDYDSDDGDNIEAPVQRRQPLARGGGAKRGGSAELKMEEWDEETQQLLDKGGTDW